MVPQRFSIVASRPPRNGFTDRVLGMPALRQLGFGLVCQQLGSVDGWPLATPETEHREATTRYGHRNGRSSVLGPPPGAPQATPPTAGSRFSIVASRPPRNGFTDRVLGMPALRQLGFGLVCQQLGSVDGWPLATPETEHREATTRYGHRNGRSSVLGPPPGAPKPHLPQRVRCGGRKPWGI
ncbi:unnamed protein product [Fusarium graminearum]|nr:unnamed protein product [Fusarium graminearum]